MLHAEVMAARKEDKINMRVDGDLLRQLDELRRDEPDVPNRAEFIRRLIRRAYEAKMRGAAALDDLDGDAVR